jgi:hypothetical protein
MSVTLIPDSLRSAVIAVHGSRCLRCGVQCTWAGPTKLHIDHVIPEARGGLTTLDNLQVLCRTCNLRKGATVADWRVGYRVAVTVTHHHRLPLSVPITLVLLGLMVLGLSEVSAGPGLDWQAGPVVLFSVMWLVPTAIVCGLVWLFRGRS